jgi:5-methylcytosine-specific restriction endonuclease McrA
VSRQEFPKSVKLAAWERCNGCCECGCNRKIVDGAEYDHIVPAAVGGPATLENCRVLARACHRRKTDVDVPRIAKNVRIAEKRAGLRKTNRGFRGSKRFDGSVRWNE